MRLIPTALEGVAIIEPDVYRDARGFFLESYHAAKYRAAGIDAVFVQDNHSRSVRGTLRGLHAQLRRPQGKLLRVVSGEIWDVAVDLRRGSPSFGRHAAVTLSADDFRQLWVPPGCFHGFCVLSDAAEVEYKVTEPYDPADEVGIVWDDPDLAIPWPISEPILSAKDRALPRLAEVLARLP